MTADDVGPQSKWDVGLPWMRDSIENAIKDEILKPASSLSLNKEEEDSYKKGFIFEKGHEILTRGHLAFPVKVQKAKQRLEAGNYLFNPAKFSFDKTVRVLSLVFRFIKSFKCRKGKLSSSNHDFQMLPVYHENNENSVLLQNICERCSESIEM